MARLKLLYVRVEDRESATDVFVEGVCQGVFDICPLYATVDNKKDTFTFRFIQFKFNHREQRFEPVLFPIKNTHKDIFRLYA